ncbi:hypothetical protein BT63DRAFT_426771 [Microthyrium microscopicum]|uniref:Glycosyl transferase CAP10 domain-containing protein n=1 Tax=Microthyrium microscopicum TaxID=703497 RepID=A0A6A6U6X2_9PEZI|nr:hypothetical protein BT63DRAFT_426771 [Microthyrium microscopicum]
MITSFAPSTKGSNNAYTFLFVLVILITVYSYFPSPVPDKWQFDAAKDGRNYTLSAEKCDQAFPGFYHEIDRALKWHTDNKKSLSVDDVAEAYTRESIRVVIYERQMYIIDEDTGPHKNRAGSILLTMNRAIQGYSGDVPNVEFVLAVGDGPSKPNQWALTRKLGDSKHDSIWVMSDHGYWSWPVPLLGEYTQLRKEVEVAEPSWKDKIPKLVWRGVLGNAKVRDDLIAVTKGKEWSDVRSMTWAGKGGTEGATKETEDIALHMVEQCNYKFLMYTEGSTYSGRFKYLHQCNSVIFTHELAWAELHGSLMKFDGPNQNMVLVKRDLSDLESKVQELLSNPAKGQAIAENNKRDFRDRYFTPAAQACYARKMIYSWSKIQTFKPELWTKSPATAAHPQRMTTRGEPFETWLIKALL